MKESFTNRLKHAYNVFRGNSNNSGVETMYSSGYTSRPDRTFFSTGSEKTLLASIYNRIAIDVGAVDLKHVRLDQNGTYMETINSELNNVLSVEANIDQTGRALILDIVLSLLDEGVVAVVPIETSLNIKTSTNFKIHTMRTGKILEWYPTKVRVRIYNDKTGRKEEIVIDKKSIAIIESPLYQTLNEPNSTLQRLITTLSNSDSLDARTSSKRLDLLFQLPYAIKSDAKRNEANKRLENLENQLANSKRGIGYIDATEKVIQLNRSVEDQIFEKVKYLTSMLYSQLGMTEEVLNGTANEATMLNYYNRTVEPILSAISDEFSRKFLTKTARTKGQAVIYIRDPFRLVPVNNLATIADKFTRNEILTSNEVRSIIGFKPVDTKEANELRNKNLNIADNNPKYEKENEDEDE